MLTAIIISIISCIGLVFSLTKKGLFQKFITIGLAFSAFIVWADNRDIIFVSIILQLGFALISIIYALIVKRLKFLDRIAIGSIGITLMLGTIWIIQRYPGQAKLRLALTIPIILFLWTTVKHGRQQPREFGFMLIWTSLAIVQLINYFIL
ncbi:MAG TPA: hypothetical protein VK027_08815 [Chitinophagaceae bacterium]|nr:hypothetical protein [Chitinophagaceae bacterium]